MISRFWKACLPLLVPATMTFGETVPPAAQASIDLSGVPGVVVNHSPQVTGIYLGSPSLAVLPNGDYLASHDEYGPKATGHAHIFRSSDRGQTWEKVASVHRAHWSSLFVHRGDVYFFGTDGGGGRITIRRSSDNGETWTTPDGAATGLLTEKRGYHTAPMPIVEHEGRLWRAFEALHPSTGWGHRFRAFVMSAPVDADLLNRASWRLTNILDRDPAWLDGQFHGWLEGNMVVTPAGGLVNMPRVDHPPHGDTSALLRVDLAKHTLHFDPEKDFVHLPGAGKKFTIRYDGQTRQYYALTNWVPEEDRSPPEALRRFFDGLSPEESAPSRRGAALKKAGLYNFERTRNTVALVCSANLRDWTILGVLLRHPDTAHHGFQYLDWQFDGDDIIALARTAYADGLGGAHNQHNANLITFHRFENFRAIGANPGS